MDVSKGKIKRLEYGVVIAAIEATQPHKTLLSYKERVYQPFTIKAQQYGSKYFLSDYSIKGYDKRPEVKQHENKQVESGLFRWELAMSK